MTVKKAITLVSIIVAGFILAIFTVFTSIMSIGVKVLALVILVLTSILVVYIIVQYNKIIKGGKYDA